MDKGIFAHIITTLSDNNIAVGLHDSYFTNKVSESICDIKLISGNVLDDSNRISIIDSIRNARANSIRLILHINDFKMLSSFPEDLKREILNNCVFIGEEGIIETADVRKHLLKACIV